MGSLCSINYKSWWRLSARHFFIYALQYTNLFRRCWRHENKEADISLKNYQAVEHQLPICGRRVVDDENENWSSPPSSLWATVSMKFMNPSSVIPHSLNPLWIKPPLILSAKVMVRFFQYHPWMMQIARFPHRALPLALFVQDVAQPLLILLVQRLIYASST